MLSVAFWRHVVALLAAGVVVLSIVGLIVLLTAAPGAGLLAGGLT